VRDRALICLLRSTGARRGEIVGMEYRDLDEVTCHAFRRSLAVRWLRARQSETLLMQLTGWSSPRMVARYTARLAQEAALEPQKALQDAEATQRRRVHRRRAAEAAAQRRSHIKPV
jgi:integrase